jgi:predicted acetyltransferase
LENEAQGIDLPPDVPAQQTYFLVLDDAKVIGEFRFRPDIAPPYERYNGHIGYNLRPAFRGKGIGTRALGLLLELARERGLAGVQMTIDGENPASARIIEKNGGYLEKRVVDEEKGGVTACYWVEL